MKTTLQFVWWPRLQFWFVREENADGLLYVWRMHIGPLEVRRLNPGKKRGAR